jgi:hypothetical protein
MGELGCPEGYQALIVSKDGIVLGDLPVSEAKFGRKLDDFSEASITVPLSDPACCLVIASIHTWHHELQLFRDGTLVWSGPIVRITGSRTAVVIEARDLMALLDKRIIHNEMCFAVACGTAAADLTVLGTYLIDDGLIVDGHNYLIESAPTGIFGERQYRIGQDNYTLNALQEVMQLGLDVTVLGRKFILGASNGKAPFGRTQALMCQDFLTDLTFQEDGLAAATRALTLGAPGFIGLAKAPGTDVNGEHPYYGLLEYVSLNRGELNTQALADQGAAALIASMFPPPTNLIMPADSQLAVTAPVTIQELVPGVLTPIIVDCLCRPVQTEMVLIEMSVNWSTDGEKVNVTYGSLGSQNSGEGAS